jgi:DNA-binding beta-propeller fold protein YncE
MDLVGDTLYLARTSTLEQLRFSAAGGTAAFSASEGWRLQDLADFAYGNAKGANALHVRWPFAYLLLSTEGGNANSGNELKVINLRTGLVTATIALPDGAGFRDGAIAYHRNRLYITRGIGTNVTIVDITNRATPSTTLGTLAVTGAAGVSVQGTQLYVGGNNELRAFSLIDPAVPTLLGSADFGGAVLQASGDFVYSSREPRPVILKVTDPSAIQLVAQPGRLRFEEGVLVIGKHVFMQDRDELSVIELQ